MNNEQIRIAIAACCGFYDFSTKQVSSGETFPIARLKEGVEHPFKWEPWIDGKYSIPDYSEDLNAMHEAESILGTSVDWTEQYIEYLKKVGNMKGIHTTARQRAEAFLRTSNKWKD